MEGSIMFSRACFWPLNPTLSISVFYPMYGEVQLLTAQAEKEDAGTADAVPVSSFLLSAHSLTD
jgi:hypothetical protein